MVPMDSPFSYRVLHSDGQCASFGTDYKSAVQFMWTASGVLVEYSSDGYEVQRWAEPDNLSIPW